MAAATSALQQATVESTTSIPAEAELTVVDDVDPDTYLIPDEQVPSDSSENATRESDVVAQSPATPRHSHKIVFQFLVLNTIAFALLGVAAFTGYLSQVFSADETRLCAFIFVVFLGGLAICAYKILRTSIDQSSVAQAEPRAGSIAARFLTHVQSTDQAGRQLAASNLRLAMSQRVTVVRHIANTLVLLGLIGTVIGFIIALSGIDPKLASDVNAIAPMVSTLIAGMSTALYTTLVGAVLNVWLMANHQLLVSGSVNLVTGLIQRGEDSVRV